MQRCVPSVARAAYAALRFIAWTVPVGARYPRLIVAVYDTLTPPLLCVVFLGYWDCLLVSIKILL